MGNRGIGDDRYVKITARFDGRCNSEECRVPLKRGDTVWYDVEERKIYCEECGATLHEEEDS